MGVKEWLMLLYAAVWGALMLVYGWSTKEWPPAEMWATLGVGEGALMATFRADEAFKKRRNGKDPDE